MYCLSVDTHTLHNKMSLIECSLMHRLPGADLTPYTTTQDRNERVFNQIPDYPIGRDRGRGCGCHTVRLCRSNTAVTSTSRR